jgi:hypothetical protein
MRPLIVLALACALLLMILPGCAPLQATPPDPRLRAAPAWMLEPCPPLPPGPKNDGDPSQRAPYEGAVRSMYADCRERQAALASRDRILTSPH